MNSKSALLSAALATVMCISAPAHAGLLGGGASGGLGGGMSGGLNHMGGMNGTGTFGGTGSVDAPRPKLPNKDVATAPAKNVVGDVSKDGKDAKTGATDTASNVTPPKVTSPVSTAAATQSVQGSTQAVQGSAQATQSASQSASTPKTGDTKPATKPAPAQSPLSGSVGGSADQSANAAGRTVNGNADGSASAEHAGRDTSVAGAGDASANVTPNK